MGKMTLEGFEQIDVRCPNCLSDDSFFPKNDVTGCINCGETFTDAELEAWAERNGILRIDSTEYAIKSRIKYLLHPIAWVCRKIADKLNAS